MCSNWFSDDVKWTENNLNWWGDLFEAESAITILLSPQYNAGDSPDPGYLRSFISWERKQYR